MGFALEDYAALAWISDAAAELGLGNVLQLVPQASDPKNLFGVLNLTPGADAGAEGDRDRDRDGDGGADAGVGAAKPAEGWPHRVSRYP